MPMHPSAEPGPTARGGREGLVLWLLPWAVSVAVHVGLVVLALFVIWMAVVDQAREQVAPVIHAGDRPSASMEPDRPSQPTESVTELREPIEAPAAAPAPAEPEPEPVEELDLLSQEAMALEADPFTAPVSEGATDHVEVFGSRDNARRIVFIVDATASFIDSMPSALRELKSTVSQLTEDQHFTLLFFNGEQIRELDPPGLVRARPQAKQRAVDWLDAGPITIQGQANPVPAIQRALSYRPELIFLLSDNIADFEPYSSDPQRLLEEIAQANTARTRINTMQFLYRDSFQARGEAGIMERIAQQTGGVYTFIDERTLGGR